VLSDTSASRANFPRVTSLFCRLFYPYSSIKYSISSPWTMYGCSQSKG